MKEKEQAYTYSLRDLLTIVFKHKFKIFFSFIIIIIITIIIAMSEQAHYVAKAVLMVKPGREYMPTSDSIISEQRLTVSSEATINAEIQILTSNDLLSKVVSSIGAFTLYPDLRGVGVSKLAAEKQAVERFLQDILIKPVRASNIIEVYYRHNDPQMAARVTNTLIEYLKDKHLQVFGETKSPFIEDQLKLYEKKLNDSTEKLSTFKNENQITSIRDQYYFIIGKRTETEATLKLEESRLDELRKKIAFLKSQKKKAISDLYTATVGAKLVDLETRETQLLATYKDYSRPVIQVRKEIQKVKDALRKYEEELKESEEWTSLEADIGPQELKIASLRQQLVRLDKQLAALSFSGEELNRLERDVSVAATNYETYLKKHEEARVSEDMDRRKITNIQIIEQAAVPLTPVKANQRKIYGVGIFLALGVSFGLAYMSEYLPQGITTAQGINKYLRLPVLVAVPYKR